MQNLLLVFGRWMGAAALGLCALGGCATAPDPAGADIAVRREHFESGGEKILLDIYTARAPGRQRGAPILVLHGAGGMLFDGPEMSRVAQDLARAGFEAYQVHYFDRTHTWFARQPVLLKLFPTWRATVHDAVEWVRQRRPDAPSIGVFGYSLGAFAAIEEARRNPALGPVVALAGGFWNAEPEGPTRHPLPPILLLHGLDDERVPFAKYTEPLLAYLRAHNEIFETHFFPGEGHQFSAPAKARVRADASDFFQRRLAPIRRDTLPLLPHAQVPGAGREIKG